MKLLPLLVLFLAFQGVREPSNPPRPSSGPPSQKKKTECQQCPSTSCLINPIQTIVGDTPLPTEPLLEVNVSEHEIHSNDKDQDPADKYKWWWSGWDVIATFVTVVCTVVIMLFTWWMYRIAGQQLELNERFFLIANRPRLRLRSLECEQFERTPKSSIPGLGKRFCPEFHARVGVVNVGGTEAIPLHGYLHVRRSRHLSSNWKPAWEPLECKNIKAGEEDGITLHKPKWSQQERDNAIGPASANDCFLIGGIRYKDSLGREYVTNFCRDFSGSRGYRLMQNSQYEYED